MNGQCPLIMSNNRNTSHMKYSYMLSIYICIYILKIQTTTKKKTLSYYILYYIIQYTNVGA